MFIFSSEGLLFSQNEVIVFWDGAWGSFYYEIFVELFWFYNELTTIIDYEDSIDFTDLLPFITYESVEFVKVTKLKLIYLL
jgi:hypothetical protein